MKYLKIFFLSYIIIFVVISICVTLVLLFYDFTFEEVMKYFFLQDVKNVVIISVISFFFSIFVAIERLLQK